MPAETADLATSRRNRKTRRSVLIADRAADWTIRIGGIFVIIAVLGIMAYLFQVVVPLFMGGETEDHHALTVPHAEEILMEVVDEYRTIAVSVDRAGARPGCPPCDRSHAFCAKLRFRRGRADSVCAHSSRP